MGYLLGVDLGTTSTSAAVARNGRATTVQLTTDSQVMPSVISIREDGEVLGGEVAERRAVTDPARTIREFKRRFGDPAPVVLGGKAYGADELTGYLLADVIRRTTTIEGAAPDRLALAHPAAWGPFRLDLLRAAAAHAGHDEVVLVPEPVAAAIANRDRLAAGALVAVYDLGGGTFDAAVVRQGPAPEVVGTPEGIERLGGVDIDLAVLAHVDAALDGQVVALDSSDPEVRAALSRLRSDCQAAKEALSSDTDVEIPVQLPNLHTSVRLTRADLESMVRPRLVDSLAVLDRVVASAGVEWSAIDSVLLVGGSSRMPLVGQMVAEHTGRPVTAATNPVFAISIGTALALDAATDDSPPSAAGPLPGAPPVVTTPPVPASPPTGRRRGPLIAGGVLAVAAVVGIGAFTLGGGDDDGSSPATSPDSAVTSPVSSPVSSPDPAPSTDPSVSDVTSAATSAPPTEPDTSDPTGEGVPVTAAVCQGAVLTDGAIGIGREAVFPTVAGVLRQQALTVTGGGCAIGVDATEVGVPAELGEITFVGGSDQGVVAAVGADGTSVLRLAQGDATVCPDLRGAAVPGPGSTLLAWTPDGPLQGYDVGRAGCELRAADLLPGAAVSAGALEDGNRALVGARFDDATTASVVVLDGGTIRWRTEVEATRLDAVGRCGDAVCAIGPSTDPAAEGLRVFVLDPEGALVASTGLADLLGTPVERVDASGPIGDGTFAVVTSAAGMLTVATLTG